MEEQRRAGLPAGESGGETLAKPSADELRAALNDKDVFRAAPIARAWVEQATVDELRAFLQDAKRFPPGYPLGFEGEFRRLFLERLLERWLTLAPGELEAFTSTDEAGLPMQETVARGRPQDFLKMVLGTPLEKQAPKLIEAAFEAMAKRDLSAARSFLEKLSTASLRKKGEAAILKGLAKQDVFAAAALVKPWNNDERDIDALFAVGDLLWEAELAGPGVLRRVLAESGGKLDGFVSATEMRFRYPDIAADLAERGQRGMGNTTESSTWQYPGGLRTGEGVPPERRAEILRNIEQLPASERTSTMVTLVSAWAKEEPQAAIEWASGRAQPADRRNAATAAVDAAFQSWLDLDSRAALAWWEKMPASRLREALGGKASIRFAIEGDLATARRIFGSDGSEESRQITSHFARIYAVDDPAGAAAWLEELPEAERGERYPTDEITSRYFVRDPEAAAAWVGGLPPGKVRAAALKRFVANAAQMDPVGAGEWIGQFPDAGFRTEAHQALAREWAGTNPKAARAWVEKQPGLDETWRKEFLRQ